MTPPTDDLRIERLDTLNPPSLVNGLFGTVISDCLWAWRSCWPPPAPSMPKTPKRPKIKGPLRASS